MARYAFAIPVLPGQEETDRQLVSEMLGARRADYVASRQRIGITAERVWLQSTPQGTLAVVYLETDDLGAMFDVMATSQAPFDVWWRAKILEIHGIDLSQPLPGPPNEKLLDYTA
jgi:hypothetical protein